MVKSADHVRSYETDVDIQVIYVAFCHIHIQKVLEYWQYLTVIHISPSTASKALKETDIKAFKLELT